MTASDIEGVLGFYGSLRHAQLEYATTIGGFLGDDNQVLFAEAATGIGKTRGYLAPLALHCAATGRKAIVSTHTLALLRQIVGEEGPSVQQAVAGAMGRQVSIGIHLGLRNFISKSRVSMIMARRAADAGLDRAGRELFKSLVAFADDPDSGLIQDWLDEYEALPSGVLPSDICVLPLCPAADKVKHAAQSGDEADIIVQTHALTLLYALRGQCPADVVVFDEADGLLSAASSMSEENVDLVRLDEIAQAAGRSGSELAAACRDFAAWAESAHPDNGHHILVDAHEDGPRAREIAERVIRILRDLESSASDLDLRQEVRDTRYQLNRFVGVESGDRYVGAAISWLLGHSNPAFRVLRLNPAGVVARLWRDAGVSKVVFTSATLEAPTDASMPDFGAFERQVGVGRSVRVAPGWRFDPNRFGRLSFVLADRDVPSPTTEQDRAPMSDPDWLDYSAAMIDAARARGGRVLVLVTSYRDTAELGKRVAAAIVHGRGQPVGPLLEAFRNDSAAVLISPAVWAGADLPGLVNHLVVTRIPFAPPDTAREELLRRFLVSRGYGNKAAEEFLRKDNYDDARRRLRQGLGRAIRRPEDHAIVWIADPRFPLPDDLVRDIRRRLGQGQAKRFLDLTATVPRRFRDGMKAPWPGAEIFERHLEAASGAA